VVSILVGLMAGKAEVKYRPSLTTPEKVAYLITDLGFGATVQDRGDKTGELELSVSFLVDIWQVNSFCNCFISCLFW